MTGSASRTLRLKNILKINEIKKYKNIYKMLVASYYYDLTRSYALVTSAPSLKSNSNISSSTKSVAKRRQILH